MTLRKDFEPLADDAEFLGRLGLRWETVIEGQVRWILVHGLATANDGYSSDRVTAAVRLEPNYPMTQLDMVFVEPHLTRKDGRPINATQASVTILGRAFQQWSRHRTAANPWRPGEDNLETHFMLISDWFQREFELCPAP